MKRGALFLHICCAPCATEVIRRLQSEYEITGFFYNPNIFPEEEYNNRLAALEKLTSLWRIPLQVGKYEHTRFLALVKGAENEPEGGRRCEVCYRLRLEESAIKAREGNYDFFASTLAVSPKKKAGVINKIGEELSANYGGRFIAVDWKKQNGFQHSVALSRQLGLYRQRYCGCEFSRSPAMHPPEQKGAKPAPGSTRKGSLPFGRNDRGEETEREIALPRCKSKAKSQNGGMRNEMRLPRPNRAHNGRRVTMKEQNCVANSSAGGMNNELNKLLDKG